MSDPKKGPSMADALQPARSRFDEAARARFDAVRRAIAAHGPTLRVLPGVIGVRPGFRFREGWITDEPAVVVTVRTKLPADRVPAGQAVPRSLDGVPVNVTSASPLEQLASQAVSKGLAAPTLSPEYEPALPDWERDEGAVPRGLSAEAKSPTQPYVPLAGVPPRRGHRADDPDLPRQPRRRLGDPRTVPRRHEAPADGRDVRFQRPPHPQGTRRGDGPGRRAADLVLDPALTLSKGKNPDSPKARDVTELEVRATLERTLKDRFAHGLGGGQVGGQDDGRDLRVGLSHQGRGARRGDDLALQRQLAIVEPARPRTARAESRPGRRPLGVQPRVARGRGEPGPGRAVRAVPPARLRAGVALPGRSRGTGRPAARAVRARRGGSREARPRTVLRAEGLLLRGGRLVAGPAALDPGQLCRAHRGADPLGPPQPLLPEPVHQRRPPERRAVPGPGGRPAREGERRRDRCAGDPPRRRRRAGDARGAQGPGLPHGPDPLAEGLPQQGDRRQLAGRRDREPQLVERRHDGQSRCQPDHLEPVGRGVLRGDLPVRLGEPGQGPRGR